MDRKSDELRRLDAALLDLRRFAQAPRDMVSRSVRGDPDDPVQISTVLVVDAVARRDGVAECSIADVADALDVAHSTASRLVARAESAGMVHRGRSVADPRRTTLSLTAVGRSLHREAVAFRTARLESLLSGWSVVDVTAFTRLLERFARSAHPPTQETP